MSSESVRATWCWTHKLVRLHVLCDIRQSIFGVTVFLPLCILSLTLSRANARFFQSSSVALRGGALLNRSRNAAIICPVCCLSCTHTCYQALLDKLNSVAAAYHVCTILDTVAKLPFYIALRAVLCKLKLSLRCVLSGCTVTSRPSCTASC
jgi:hypothetical protein